MSHSNPNTQALDQAIATFAAIRTPRLYGRHDNLFGTRRWWAFRRNYESLWPYADTWSALCTLVSLPGQTDAMICSMAWSADSSPTAGSPPLWRAKETLASSPS